MIGHVRWSYGICLPTWTHVEKRHIALFLYRHMTWSNNRNTNIHSNMSGTRTQESERSIPGPDNDADGHKTADPSTSSTRPAARRKSTEASHDKSSTGVEMIDGRPRDEFDRFTKSQKRRMTAIVSFSALLSRMSSLHSSGKLTSSNGILNLSTLRPPTRKRSQNKRDYR